MGRLKTTKARDRILELYIELANKPRYAEEEKIFQQIESYCLPIINDSIKYYFKLHEKHAKVGRKTFYYRYYNLGYSKWDAMTLSVKDVSRISAKKRSETMKNKFKEKKQVEILNETEQDIIRFIQNELPLNPRQLKYIEDNEGFAKKIEREGIC